MAPYDTTTTTSIAALSHALPMTTAAPTATAANYATAVRWVEKPQMAFQLHESTTMSSVVVSTTPAIVVPIAQPTQPTQPTQQPNPDNYSSKGTDPGSCRKYCRMRRLWPVWYREAHRPRVPPCECPGAARARVNVNHVDTPIVHKKMKRAVADDGDDSSSSVDTSVDDQAAADAEAEDGKVAPDITEKPYADTAETAAAAATAEAASTKCKAGDWDCTCQEYCDKGDTGTFPIYRAANSTGGDTWSSTTIYCVDCCAMNVTNDALPRWLVREARAAPGSGRLSMWEYLGQLIREHVGLGQEE